MHRRLSAVALSVVLLAGLLAGTGVGAQDRSPTAGNASTAVVSVSGTGVVTAAPDRATVGVAASATADNASEATRQLAAQVADLRAAFADAGLARESVRTTDFQVFQRTEDDGTTYVARQAFEVTVNDTAAVGRTIDLAVANGATDVFGVEFAVSDERRARLRTAAIDRAVADAREQADAVAASTGLTLGTVRSVSTDGGAVPFAAVESRTAGDGTDIDASPVRVTASVSVTYEATSGGDR
jgi:hypothetical protein